MKTDSLAQIVPVLSTHREFPTR